MGLIFLNLGETPRFDFLKNKLYVYKCFGLLSETQYF